MLRSITVGLFAIVFSTVAAQAAHIPRSGYVVHEKRDAAPEPWTRTRRLAPDVMLPMRFGLQQQNIHRLEELLLEVSHPDSANYGKHWSPAQLAETFAPSRESIEAVKVWLENSGVETKRMRLSPSKGWIDLNATAEEVEALLDAEYHVYKHEDTGHEHVG